MDKPEFKFLPDKPLKKDGDGYYDFYHASVAPALKKILSEESAPHTVGLFGGWGAGKSTIIEMVSDELAKEDIPVFVFDAWKYQEDSLRRIFLLELKEFLEGKGVEFEKDILLDLYSARETRVQKERAVAKPKLTRKQIIGQFLKRHLLFIAAVLLLSTYALIGAIWPDNVVVKFIQNVLTIVAGISAVTYVMVPLLDRAIQEAANSFFTKKSEQTELLTIIHQEDRLNSPEQFEKKFKAIVEAADQKMVIVFDNIDRVQGDVAISMLATIKTFMYSSENGPVFLIPCDAQAIEAQIKKYFGSSDIGSDEHFESTEYLRKIFNLIVWMPEFVATDLEEYTRARIKDTGQIGDLLDNEDVVLVITSAFSKNPREIIQFINNLVATMLAIQGTPVSTVINGNTGFLAKVLVLRQRFPDAYNKLKENWHRPANIIEGLGTESELVKFFNNTNRVSTDNAEPFIYFKDPIQSRNLENADELSNALVNGDVEAAVKLAEGLKTEEEKLADFIRDQVRRYQGQEQVLLNVINTQFAVVRELDLTMNFKNYTNSVAELIDKQLWGSYQKLPIEDIFTLLKKSVIEKDTRRALLERLIASLETKELNDTTKAIINGLRTSPRLLSQAQIDNTKRSLETSFSANSIILSLFDKFEDQQRFISVPFVSAYIDGIGTTNISSRLANLEAYKDFILANDLLKPLVEKLSALLDDEHATDSDFNSKKDLILNAVNKLPQIFGKELDSLPDEMDTLGNTILTSYDYTSNWEGWVKEIITLRWIKYHVTEPVQKNITESISEFFGKSPIEGWKQVLDYWSAETRRNFINTVLTNILPQLASEVDRLNYIYDHANDSDKTRILSYVIAQTPANNDYAINFLTKQTKIPERKKIVSELMRKVTSQYNENKRPYLDYLAHSIYKSDDRDVRDLALDQVKELVTLDDTSASKIGFDFFQNLRFANESDRRSVAKYLLDWLREPGRSVSYLHKNALEIITLTYDQLQETAKSDYVYLLFSLLDDSRDIQTIEMIIGALSRIKPAYDQFSKDYDDLLAKLQTWPNDSARELLVKTLPTYKVSRPKKAEKEYWSTINKLTSE